jgi:hypothetical protein
MCVCSVLVGLGKGRTKKRFRVDRDDADLMWETKQTLPLDLLCSPTSSYNGFVTLIKNPIYSEQ